MKRSHGSRSHTRRPVVDSGVQVAARKCLSAPDPEDANARSGWQIQRRSGTRRCSAVLAPLAAICVVLSACSISGDDISGNAENAENAESTVSGGGWDTPEPQSEPQTELLPTSITVTSSEQAKTSVEWTVDSVHKLRSHNEISPSCGYDKLAPVGTDFIAFTLTVSNISPRVSEGGTVKVGLLEDGQFTEMPGNYQGFWDRSTTKPIKGFPDDWYCAPYDFLESLDEEIPESLGGFYSEARLVGYEFRIPSLNETKSHQNVLFNPGGVSDAVLAVEVLYSSGERKVAAMFSVEDPEGGLRIDHPALTASTTVPPSSTISTTTVAPTSTQAAPTTVAPTTTEAQVTSGDTLIADKDAIQTLVYNQQKLIADIAGRSYWTSDTYLEYRNYLRDHTEPSYAAAGRAACSNWEEIDRYFWDWHKPPQSEAAQFLRWVVDLDTVTPDDVWRPQLFGRTLGPFDGRTYIASVTFEALDGSSSTSDVHFNVQGGEAFWFFSPPESNSNSSTEVCLPG